MTQRRSDFIPREPKYCENCGAQFSRPNWNIDVWRKARFCSRTCASAVVHRTDEVQRFEDNIMPEPNSGCFIWLGTISQFGYGQIRLNGRLVLAHRHAFAMDKGRPIGDGLLVCHKCDTPLCVNPNHLFLGTEDDNNKDAARKGRTARGEANGSARLKLADVELIRSDTGSNQAMADKFGVTSQAIRSIRTKKTWRHAP